MVKVSIVVPTYNEESNIKDFINLLNNQTYSADEIIICDGNSTDNTIPIIKSFCQKNKKIKLVKRNGSCRGSGRNSGIKESRNELIALIDAGTKPKIDWLEKLIKDIELNKDTECVYGSVVPLIEDNFTECLSIFLIGKNRHFGRINRSVASILISKKLWKKVGGFPESKNNTFIVEDLIFLENIKKSNINFIENLEAEVSWILPNKYFDVFKKIKTYFYGGLFTGHAKKWTTLRNLLINMIFLILGLNYSFFYLIPILFFHLIRSFSYFIDSYWIKKKLNLIILKKFFILSIQLLVIDIATYYGLLKYIFMLKWKKSQ
tara:strand:- start:454 stop:1410 length:957 start_codon:yes stop_codon:yes gene_type:complete